MKVSIVIPSLNSVTVHNTLRALLQQTVEPDEIIVVGRDEVGGLDSFSNIHFIDTGAPVCAAAARNRGIEASRGDVVIFLDADCIPKPDWLAQHILSQREGKEVVGGSVSFLRQNYWMLSDNVSMFHEFLAEHPPGFRRLLPTLNLSVRRTVIQAVGGLDETFDGAAAEDADWTIRMRLAGFSLYFEPSANILHSPARTTWSDVVRHWNSLGHNAIRVRLRYQEDFGTPRFARSSRALRLLSLPIAIRVTMGIYANRMFWRYWKSLPTVLATKMIYCFGAARAIESGYAFEDNSRTKIRL